MSTMAHAQRSRGKRFDATIQQPTPMNGLVAEMEALRAELAAKDAELARLKSRQRPSKWADLYLQAMYDPRWVAPISVHLDAGELDDTYRRADASGETFAYLAAAGLVERHPTHAVYSLTDAGREYVESQERSA
jgi:hypothetical protein